MSEIDLTFVSFEKKQEGYIAYIPIKQFLNSDRDEGVILKKAAKFYELSITRMQSIVTEIEMYRMKRTPLPARKIWMLGNLIFELVEDLKRLTLQIDDIYQHLIRDLNVKRKWLEKVIIFRRYISSKDRIPESLNWGRCEKGTRRKATMIQNGQLPD